MSIAIHTTPYAINYIIYDNIYAHEKLKIHLREVLCDNCVNKMKTM